MNSLLPGVASYAIPYVGALEIGAKVNRHIFYPIVEKSAKVTWGVLGEDPL